MKSELSSIVFGVYTCVSTGVQRQQDLRLDSGR